MSETEAKLDEVPNTEDQTEPTETPDASPEETPAESTSAEAGADDVASSPTMVLDLEPPAEKARKDKTRIYQGVCRWFNPKDGYGFIECKDDGVEKDVWVHQSNIQTESGEDGKLVEGQECTFEIITRPPRNPNEAPKHSAQNVVAGPAPKVPRKPKAERHKGVCLWFNDAPDKRFGFIKVNDTEQQIFVHGDAIKHGKPKLVEGQPCDFEIVEQQDGRARAHNVNPGPAPPPDPAANKIHSGKVARWLPERGFGFIRPDAPDAEEVMVHRSNLKSSGENLVEDQLVRYKIRMRRKRRDGAESPRPEAVEVVPGEVPKRQIYHGVVKFFEPEKGFGFIHRTGRNEDYYVHTSQIVSHGDDETPVVLEEGQHCTFVPSTGKNNKLRAIKVIPGAKAEEEKEAEAGAQEEAGATAEADTPTALPEDDNLTEEERARREFNYRKKQRRKRAKERQAKDPNYKKPVAAPPVPSPEPEETQSPRVDRPSKKQKKDKRAEKAAKKSSPSPPPEKPKAEPSKPAPPKPERKERDTADIPKNQKKPKKKPQQAAAQSQEDSKVLFRKNKKQSKKSKRGQMTAEMKKRRAAEARKEQDAVSGYFDQQAKREAQNQTFFTWAYNWVVSWCKW